MSAGSPAIHFGAKVSEYQKHAKTQHKIAETLSKTILNQPDNNSDWLDIGSGPGVVSQYFYNFHPEITPFLLDISYQTLETLSNNTFRICGDMDNLPFLPNSFAGITAASSFQWSTSISALLKNIAILIKPTGRLAIAVFTDESLSELRKSQIEFGIANPVVFPARHEWQKLLSTSGFTITSEHSEQYIETYSSGKESLRAISRIGAGFHSSSKLSPSTLKKFISYYESLFCNTIENKYSVSYFIASRE